MAVCWWFSESLEVYGQTVKVKVLSVLSSCVQLLGQRLGAGTELGLTRG